MRDTVNKIKILNFDIKYNASKLYVTMYMATLDPFLVNDKLGVI